MFDTIVPFLVFWEEKILAKCVPNGFYLLQFFSGAFLLLLLDYGIFCGWGTVVRACNPVPQSTVGNKEVHCNKIKTTELSKQIMK